MRARYDPVPDRRALRLLAGLPRRHLSRPAAIGTNPPRPHLARRQLTECARAAVRTKGTYLAAHFAQLRGRAASPKRSARSATTCSSPTTTSSVTKSHSGSSVRTGSASATRPSTAHAGSSANSKRSATRSHSSESNDRRTSRLNHMGTQPFYMPSNGGATTLPGRTRKMRDSQVSVSDGLRRHPRSHENL